MSVLPVARVEDVDRYVVTRIDTLPGFYGVAQYQGFRDEPSFHIDEIITKINELEARLRPDEAGLTASQLKDHSVRLTHVYVSGQSLITVTCTEPAQCRVPHYAVRSKGLVIGRITPIMNYIRRVLIEEVYGRLSKAFRPRTTVHWILTHAERHYVPWFGGLGGSRGRVGQQLFNNRYVR